MTRMHALIHVLRCFRYTEWRNPFRKFTHGDLAIIAGMMVVGFTLLFTHPWFGAATLLLTVTSVGKVAWISMEPFDRYDAVVRRRVSIGEISHCEAKGVENPSLTTNSANTNWWPLLMGSAGDIPRALRDQVLAWAGNREDMVWVIDTYETQCTRVIFMDSRWAVECKLTFG